MKKVILVFALCMAFVVLVTIVVFARTLEEEAQAVRDYLAVVDAKLTNAKQVGNERRIELLHAEKSATLARWYKLKGEMTVAPVPVTPVKPAPVVVKPVAPAPRAIFGMGINTTLAAQFINDGKNSTIYGLNGVSAGFMGNVIIDPASIVGISGDAVKLKLGTGYFYTSGTGGLQAIPVYAGGIIHLPKWLGGQETYLTGGLNYVVYGNGQTSGKLGGDIYFGVTADLGFGLERTGFEVGYNVVRSNTVTSRGFCFSVSQPILI